MMPQVRESIVQLETHMAEIHRQAARLVKRQLEHGVSLEEFAASMAALGKCEKQPPLSMQFERLAEWAGKLAKLSQVLHLTPCTQASSLCSSPKLACMMSDPHDCIFIVCN